MGSNLAWSIIKNFAFFLRGLIKVENQTGLPGFTYQEIDR